MRTSPSTWSSRGSLCSTSSTSSCPALSSPLWLFWPFFYLHKVFASVDILRLMYSMPQNTVSLSICLTVLVVVISLFHSVCLCTLFVFLSVSFSWRAEVDCVHFCTVGSDCVSHSDCSEDSRNVTFRASDWQVSVIV